MSGTIAEHGQQSPRAVQPATAANRGIRITNSAELMELANILHVGGLNGPGMSNPQGVAIMLGAALELGIPLMNAANSIKVMGGKPSIYGAAGYTLLRRHPDYDTHDVGIDGTGDERSSWIRSKRKQETKWRETRYSVADAKRAGLWGKKGPWTTNPERMLGWRALGFHLADWWSEVLNGMDLAEIAEDYETERGVGGQGESNVVVTGVSVSVPVSSPVAASQPVQQPQAITNTQPAAKLESSLSEETLDGIATMRRTWLIAQGINPDQDEQGVKAAWKQILTKFGVETARDLTPDLAISLIEDMKRSVAACNSETPAPFGSSAAGQTT